MNDASILSIGTKFRLTDCYFGHRLYTIVDIYTTTSYRGKVICVDYLAEYTDESGTTRFGTFPQSRIVNNVIIVK